MTLFSLRRFAFTRGYGQRALSAVPRPIVAAFAAALLLQLGGRALEPPPSSAASDLPPPPSIAALRFASLGEPEALAKLLMLYLQAFDYQTGSRVPYQKLDYDIIIAWLTRILALDPAAQYPLQSAARLYADIPNPDKQRKMLEFIYREFLVDPDKRWSSLAQAALIAKHELHDLPLALRYANAIADLATGPDVPPWARTIRIFLLEDMNELQQVTILLNSLLHSGTIHDPSEIRFLQQRLDELKQRSAR
jgi:hypothetical protein